MSTEHHQAPPSTDGDEQLLDHAYDGIQEYDNPLPRWWVAIFWATILFAPAYILYFHFGPGLSAVDRYDAEMVAFFDKQAQQLLALGEIDDALLSGLADDAAMMKGAKKIFQSKCATCHGAFGEGGIGPNLTDPYWLHGGRPTAIYATISEGVLSKGMLAWKRQLKPAELLAVASYVGTLEGSNPPNPKAPQGELFDPSAAVAPADPGEDAAAAPTTPAEESPVEP